MMKPPQETAFVADVAAPAAVQSTRARWLAAVCSTAALPAPKARTRHVIVIFFRFGWLSEPPAPAARWTLQLCGRASHPQARMTPMRRIAPPRHHKWAPGSNKPKRPGPADEIRRGPSLNQQRRAGGRLWHVLIRELVSCKTLGSPRRRALWWWPVLRSEPCTKLSE